MGLPIIQIYMIVARQLSKPVTGYFMRMGKEHPAFRDRILIPIGKAMTNWSTRLRMKNLGLGAPTSVANISEEIALEQASEVIHQVAMFGYTVAVFYAYSYFTYKEEKELATAEEMRDMGKKLSQQIMRLNVQCTELQDEVRVLRRDRNWPIPWLGKRTDSSPPLEGTAGGSPKSVDDTTDARPVQPTAVEFTKTISRTEALNRLANATDE
ncbi:hypothetical protein GPALN_012517 [Globodera pallida]|nr:hypothetical protein GPALN_012517 [Globodera pallida]